MDFYLGTVSLFAFNYAPQGWAPCNGALVPISQNQALFSLLGVQYGGNGVQTFGLPDLRGRVPIGMGQGGGQPNYAIGQTGGATSVPLTVQNLAPHTHAGGLNIVTASRGVTPEPPVAGDLLYTTQSVPASSSPATVALGGVTTQPAGGGQPVAVMQPYLALNYCICTQGIYPPRQ